MKKIILIFSFIFIVLDINAQFQKIEKKMYKTAFKYIVKENKISPKKYIVSDSIIDLDRFWASPQLVNSPKEKELVDSYRERKKFIWKNNFQSENIKKIFGKPKIDEGIYLFFSEIEDNMLVAQLFKINGKKFGSFPCYHKVSQSANSNFYLFIYNQDGSIKKAISNEFIPFIIISY